MALEPLATKNESFAFRLIAITVVLGVAAIQIETVRRLFPFGHIAKVKSTPFTRFVSGAVCGTELIFLMDTHRESRSYAWLPRQICATDEVHCDLRTGSIRTAPASPDVRHAVSDGTTLWRLPSDERVAEPFAWSGRPVALDASNHVRLWEFAEGDWGETNEYVIMPEKHPCNRLSPSKGASTVLQGLYFIRNSSSVFIHTELPVGTEQQFIAFNREFYRPRQGQSGLPLIEFGWRRADFRPSDNLGGAFSPYLDQLCMAVWIDGPNVCALQRELGPDRTEGFRLLRSTADRGFEIKPIRSPIQWDCVADPALGTPAPRAWRKVVKSNAGEIYVVAFHEIDGRIHVLQLCDDHLQVVAQRCSPLFFGEFRRALTFVSCAVIAPMFALGIAAAILQFFQRRRVFHYAHQTVPLASALQRGLARLIDCCIPVTLVTASIILHPDVIGWWFEVIDKWNHIVSLAEQAASATSPNLRDFALALNNLSFVFVSPPSLTWLIAIAIAFELVQVIWQGRTGNTVGKWLFRIKALRTTLRPCGVARSLLREILLIIDSLFLLSWVPGVLSILLMNQSRRIGDLCSDTIVIRDKEHGKKF